MSASPASPSSHTLDSCRICGGKDLVIFLNLGNLPLVNDYPLPGDPRTPLEFPLQIAFCRKCCLSQLTVVVNPEILYRNYSYFSSVSRTFQTHCESMATDLVQRKKLKEQNLVVEIASNDGCLLANFQKLGCRTLGVEPASNLAAVAQSRGLKTLNQFWSEAASEQIVKEFGKASLVVATNVLAHVHDLHGFIRAVASTLTPQGAFVFEVPYMVNFMNRAEFDTAYHEHLSYFLLKPLQRVLAANGLKLVEVQEFDIHGGSIRVQAEPESSNATPSANVTRLLELEEGLGLYDEVSYLRFASHVALLKEELTTFIYALKARGKTIAAYGASAKGSVLLNYCGLGADVLSYVVDDTPAKQGRVYTRGRLPIVGRTHLNECPPNYLLLLAWNFVDELVKNTADYHARGGRYIIPIPSLRVI